MFAAWLVMVLALGAQSGAERVADIQIHGNVLTSEADIRSIAAIDLGQPLEAYTLEEVASRLRATRRFQKVEVLKRFASIDDLSKIAVVIVVDEGPVTIDWNAASGATVRPRRGPRLMYWPIFDHEDGYGLTYGLRTTIPDPLGKPSRISVPLSWGASKHAAIEVTRDVGSSATRFSGGVSLERRTHPFFDSRDERRRVWLRGERVVTRALRVAGSGGVERATLVDEKARATRVGVDATYDTRIDPMLARNAVFARASWDHVSFPDRPAARVAALDGAAYVGLFRQNTIEIRAKRQDSSRPLPTPFRPLFGGADTVRGFKVGSAIGDTLVSGSAELRLPMTSPLRVGKVGLSAFVDLGTIYDKGESIRKQKFDQGIGAGVWFSAAFVRLKIDVAHGIGGSTRVHIGSTVLF